mmetsp:Transcript_29064/g.33234  ORF Transcript_29064/g.33234 Transcript_29064/m.33234 type:complete len:363 (-) Transcript_29064:71-1159(-)
MKTFKSILFHNKPPVVTLARVRQDPKKFRVNLNHHVSRQSLIPGLSAIMPTDWIKQTVSNTFDLKLSPSSLSFLFLDISLGRPSGNQSDINFVANKMQYYINLDREAKLLDFNTLTNAFKAFVKTCEPSQEFYRETMIPLILNKLKFAHSEGLIDTAWSMNAAEIYDETLWDPLLEEIQDRAFELEIEPLEHSTHSLRQYNHHEKEDLEILEGYVQFNEMYQAVKTAANYGRLRNAHQTLGRLESRYPEATKFINESVLSYFADSYPELQATHKKFLELTGKSPTSFFRRKYDPKATDLFEFACDPKSMEQLAYLEESKRESEELYELERRGVKLGQLTGDDGSKDGAQEKTQEVESKEPTK